MDIPLFNREASWLEFNRRVLAEAELERVPLLERIKFLSIAATNLDEFLMVRAGAIRELIASGIRERSVDGLTPKQQLKVVRDRVKSLQHAMYGALKLLGPKLRAASVRIEGGGSLTRKQQAALTEEFQSRVAPILTPLAYDPGQPLPFLASGALNLAIILGAGDELHTTFIKIPRLLPRFIAIPGTTRRFLPIEELVREHVSWFFPGLDVKEVVPFRVIRNADSALREDDVEDLLKSLETQIRMRDRKEVVWLEVDRKASEHVLSLLQRELNVSRDDVYLTPGLPKLGDLMEIYGRIERPSLKDEAFSPRIPAELATRSDLFSIIRAGDVLLHRPYDSYAAVAEFVQAAADDPAVLAIKQTLYRTEPGSVVVDALARAAGNGKQVTALVELQARFDEERNIAWARQLEEAGVQVVYGLVGIKTHAKMCLVIRQEGSELRRYLHLSTGNYNARTARLYTDIDLFTADPEMGEDAAHLMNLITGYSTATSQELFAADAPRWPWRRLIVAPTEYHAWVIRMIEREAANARNGKPAQIIAKMNALVEPKVIGALYEAAAAGVRIDLIVRGICCLVPQQNIRVVSVVDRFLEHSRIFLFRNGGKTEVFASSGDWMPRNFFRRVEATWPILSPALRDRLELQVLGTCLTDDANAWRLQPDGSYRRRKGVRGAIRSQERFIEVARAETGNYNVPYEESVKKAALIRKKNKQKK